MLIMNFIAILISHVGEAKSCKKQKHRNGKPLKFMHTMWLGHYYWGATTTVLQLWFPFEHTYDDPTLVPFVFLIHNQPPKFPFYPLHTTRKCNPIPFRVSPFIPTPTDPAFFNPIEFAIPANSCSGKMHSKSTHSSFRDRTQEFHSISDRLKKSLSGSNEPTTSDPTSSSSPSSRSEDQRSAVAIKSEFNKRASKIGYGIHQTSQKLAKLAKCNQFHSLFNS